MVTHEAGVRTHDMTQAEGGKSSSPCPVAGVQLDAAAAAACPLVRVRDSPPMCMCRARQPFVPVAAPIRHSFS